jgi:uncharacterized membrane protein (DUF485 family)
MVARENTIREVSIDYLRAFVTLLVLAHHSSLAYTTFAHLDVAHYLGSTAPIVDARRWAFLDYAENFNDVFFMSLMFFISGLFVWPALKKKGVGNFLRDRLLRLGVPFVAGAVFLMPLAYYPSWLADGGSPGYFEFWFHFILKDGWSSGPLWFIWVLLFFDAIAAGLYSLLRNKGKGFAFRSAPKAFLAMFLVSFITYVPMIAHFGFGTWIPFFFPPLWFQVPRILLYVAWFIAGMAIGSKGIGNGIVAENGPLARRWPWWIAACALAYNLLWFVPGILESSHASRLAHDLSYVTLWVLSCCASCFAFLALFRGAITKRRAWMDSLARSAYLMYVVHYIFVTWAQYFLLGLAASAEIKFCITLGFVIAASWVCASLLRKIPRLGYF